MTFFRSLRAADSLAVCRSVPLSNEKCTNFLTVARKKAPLPPSSSLRSLHNPQYNAGFHSVHASCGLGVPMQIRLFHTDVTKVPDFTNYRVNATKSPTSRASDSELQRKVFGYTMMFAGAVMATTAAKYTVKTFIMPLGPTSKTLAEASTEVSLATIPEGKNLVVKWRNKPLFVRHRTAEEISRERAVPLSELRDPEPDENRVQQDEWLVCLGVCTHLGCVPIANAGDFPGGFYCPCHGSHYDASGRIRKGPAPNNLHVPKYTFIDESTILVG
ncbi:hypothetical protein AHF37_03970 [Paragonimus kellicotti]|nr:hypothetical protein AHF37_03970 [Paragonimus kellicotti]